MDGIFGRTEEIGRAAGASGGLLVVTGDSGIGKSTVLRGVQQVLGSKKCPAVAPAFGHDGSLLGLLLGQLSEACALAVPIEGRKGFLHMLARVGERITSATGKEVGRVVSKQLISLVRARFGDEIVDSAERVLKDISVADGSDLTDRLTRLADGDSVRAFGEIAREVVGMTGPLTLLVDRAERLTPSDFGLLLECPEVLPDELSLVVAHRVASAVEADRVRLACDRGASELKVKPLRNSVVESWAATAGMSTHHARMICRLAGGYPLVVESAIQHIRSGRELEDLPVTEAFSSLAESAWRGLSFDVRRMARLLLGFPDPPTTAFICALLQTDEASWRTTEEELINSRTFSSRASGSGWFHDRRRKALWDGMLTPHERQEIADRVLSTIAEETESEAYISFFVVTASAALAPFSSEFRRLPGVIDVLDVSDAELAVLYSLIELMDGEGSKSDGSEPRFVDTEALLSDARAMFAQEQDLIPVLEKLVSRDLIYVASNNHASITTIRVPSAQSYRVLLGRHVLRFGRAPQSRIATAIFEVAFRTAAGAFTHAIYGIGRPTLRHMQDSLNRIPRETLRYPRPPSILLKARVATRDFYLAAEYEDTPSRDKAIRGLAHPPPDLWGDPLAIDVVRGNPGDPFPDERFVAAAAAVSGAGSWFASHAPDAVDSLSHTDASELRLAMSEHIRDQASEAELLAVGLDQERGYAIWHDEGSNIRIEYVGGGAEVREFSGFGEMSWNDPLFVIKAMHKLNLPPEAIVTNVHYSVGRGRLKDPVAEVALNYREKMRSFNRDQQELFVDVTDVGRTSELLRNSLMARHADREALYRANIPILGQRNKPRPLAVYALLVDAKYQMGDLKDYGLAYVQLPADEPSFEYSVRLGEESDDYRTLLAEEFSLRVSDGWSGNLSTASSAIARWLGYESSRVRVSRFPEW